MQKGFMSKHHLGGETGAANMSTANHIYIILILFFNLFNYLKYIHNTKEVNCNIATIKDSTIVIKVGGVVNTVINFKS